MTAISHAAGPVRGLQDYVRTIEALLDRRPALPTIIREASLATAELCSDDRWLGSQHRIASPDSYTRHLLHRDRMNRFVVLSLVWLPGQATPVHDHDCWGVMGVLQSELEEVHYDRLDDGSRPDHADLSESRRTVVGQGAVAHLLPPYEEIHRIGNIGSRPAISVHVYGRDLDDVRVYDPVSGKVSTMRIRYYSPECGTVPFVI
jgi:predicted metal-dependent enzyme (double-stranded beta helix superfamily)